MRRRTTVPVLTGLLFLTCLIYLTYFGSDSKYTEPVSYDAEQVHLVESTRKENIVTERPAHDSLTSDQNGHLIGTTKAPRPIQTQTNTTKAVKPGSDPVKKVVILLVSDGKGSWGGLGEAEFATTIKERKAYAERHNYEFMFKSPWDYALKSMDPPRGPVWSKIPAAREAFQSYPNAEWVWWLDADAIIMEPELDLYDYLLSREAQYNAADPLEVYIGTDHLPVLNVTKPVHLPFEHVDIIVSQDHTGINAGSFFLRRSDWTHLFLDMWDDKYIVQANLPSQEQDALLYHILTKQTVREHVLLVKQRKINGYVWGASLEANWHPGDLVVHFAGCWVEKACLTHWKLMMDRRENKTH